MTTLHHNLSLKDEIRDYWSMRSESFDSQPGHEIFSAEERRAWLKLFARHLGEASGKRALDLASGTGVISLLLAELGYTVTGLDLSEPMLARARAKTAGKPIRLYAGDAEDTLEADESYDVVATRHLVWTLAGSAGLLPRVVPCPEARRQGRDRRCRHDQSAPGRWQGAAPARPDRKALCEAAAASGSRRAPCRYRLAGLFLERLPAREVARLLGEAGFVDMVIDRDLRAIHRAQGRFMPLHQRLERASQDRFLVSARKPD